MPDQVRAGLLEGIVKIGIIRARRQEICIGFVIDGSGFLPAEGCHRFPVEAAAIHHQEDSLVIDAAVRVHAAAVVRTLIVVETGHLVRMSKPGRVAHAPKGAQTHDIFADLPFDANGIRCLSVGLIVILTPQI